MKITNRTLKRESLTRAKKTSKSYVKPKKNNLDNEISIVTLGHYWVVSSNNTEARSS